MTDIYVLPEVMSEQKEYACRVREIIKEKYAHPTVFLRTFGCQQNEADTERLAGIAAECGYTVTDDEQSADLIIINTCAIREHAEKRALSGAGQFKKIKKDRPNTVIAVCGCMAQQEYRKDQIKNSYPYVDLVFGTDKNHLLAQMLYTVLKTGKRQYFVSGTPHDELGVIAEDVPVLRSSGYKAWVSIMYGCNNFCSYCVVPYVRGRERSRNSAEILKEVKALIDAGYKDITLLGQNVNSYKGDMDFPDLLDAAASFEGDYRIRFMTSHPKDASDKLIEVMKKHPETIARHFHLPAQAGNDRVLKAMNRKYTREKYLETVRKIKEAMPETAITTDIICGFPTETAEEFEDTVSLIKEVGYDMIYTFIYSPRPGTVAAKMEGHIDHDEQVRRFQRLSKVQDEISAEKSKSYLGKRIKVLSDGNFEGRNSQNKIITLDTDIPAGQFVTVEITETKAYGLKGKVIN